MEPKAKKGAQGSVAHAGVTAAKAALINGRLTTHCLTIVPSRLLSNWLIIYR
jgi:hypothetical protein